MRLLTILLLSSVAYGQYVATTFNSGATAGTCGNGSLVQIKVGGTNCSTSTCTVSGLTSTGSGHILVAIAMFNHASNETISAVSAGGTFTHCTTCNSKDQDNDQNDASYTLNSTSGVTSITLTLTAAPTGGVWFPAIVELNCTGTNTFDTANSGVDNTACTSCAGQALTLTGTSEAVIQVITPSGVASAVTSPFNTNYTQSSGGDSALSVAVAQTSASAPTWTTTSGKSAVMALAFN